MQIGKDKDHKHCWHPYEGSILMVVPNGHVVVEYCECGNVRTIHAGHKLKEKR